MYLSNVTNNLSLDNSYSYKMHLVMYTHTTHAHAHTHTHTAPVSLLRAANSRIMDPAHAVHVVFSMFG